MCNATSIRLALDLWLKRAHTKLTSVASSIDDSVAAIVGNSTNMIHFSVYPHIHG